MNTDYTGRDRQTGRLLPGAKIGGGNPNTKRQHELKKALMSCATEDDIKTIYASMFKAATADPPDTQAAKFLLDHLVGKPSQSIELTGAGDDSPVRVDFGVVMGALRTALGDDTPALVKVAAVFQQLDQPHGQERVADGLGQDGMGG
jgi:hypothetical protein